MKKGIAWKLLTGVMCGVVALSMTFNISSSTHNNFVNNSKQTESITENVVENTVKTEEDKVVQNAVNLMSLENEIVTYADGWKISDNTDIFWLETQDSKKTNSDLVSQVQLFASELATKVTNTSLSIIYGKQEDITGYDIVLNLDSNLGIVEQGYNVFTNGSNLYVNASDADGLFYGCRYVIQTLVLNGSVVDKADSPDVNERSLSLDMGRKYYTVDWIKNLIQEMSWSNMNALILHFSEEMGLGLESKLYPWLAGRNGEMCTQALIETDNRYITQDELRDIAAFAKKYHVELIPSFDSPGHMNYIVDKYNKYHNLSGFGIGNYYKYNNQTTLVKGSRNQTYSRGIDISNEEAVNFTRSLVSEYANLFKELGCTKFDIGGDELLGWGSAITSSVDKWQQLDHWKEYAKNRTGNNNAVAYDAFMLYMNDLYDLVSSLGYTSVRMWNDDALRSADTGWNKVVELNKNIEVLYWTSTANNYKNNVWTYLNEGYKVHNYLCYYNYYVLGVNNADFAGTYAESIYKNWNPYVFDPSSSVLGTGKNTALGNTNVLGSAFLIWCDNPAAESEETVMNNIVPMICANGAKAWDALASNNINYTAFNNNITKLGKYPTKLENSADIIDLNELKGLIAEFNSYEESEYEATSFTVYKDAVNTGAALLTAKTYKKEEVDTAVNTIKAAKNGLKENVSINENLKLYKATFKGANVAKGKLATLSVMADSETKSFVVYDKESGSVVLSSVTLTTMKTDVEGTSYYYIKFKTTDKGNRTFEIYAVDANGNRSQEAIEASLNVK